jgi:hypothetical protein
MEPSSPNGAALTKELTFFVNTVGFSPLDTIYSSSNLREFIAQKKPEAEQLPEV